MRSQDRKQWILLFTLLFFYISMAFVVVKYESTGDFLPMMKLFTVTAYCPNACCNGKWAGQTATGKTIDFYLKQGKNIVAVDPKVIPLGSEIIFASKRYSCVDVGGRIKGNRLDVLLPTHAETVKFGVKKNQLVWRLP